MTQQELFDQLAERYGPEIAQAFLDSISDIKDVAELQRVIAAIEIGDVEGVIEAIHVEPGMFGKVEEAIRTTFLAGGEAGGSLLPGALVFRFDIRNTRAEAWLREHSSTLVTRIVEDQRLAIRQRLEEGMVAGQNPRTVALDIVGRVNRRSGRREGGIVGLSAPQERYVANARAELASGDPEALARYLTRERRDKRFDPSVRRAIRDEAPIPAETRTKMVLAYERRLLQLRGETIGRTEALASLHAARHQAFRQAIDEGKIREVDVRRVWRSAKDRRVRDSHKLLDTKVAGMEEPFRSPLTGALLLYPGDFSLGAPASETINCRCTVDYRVDWLANVR